MVYSLDAPISTNWASFYSPSTAGGNMQSIVMPDTSFTPVAWNASGQNLNYSSGWVSSINTTFETFTNSSMADGEMVNSNGLNWQRKFYSLTTDPAMPITMIKDDFTGNTAVGKVMTLNLRNTGPVTTPAGPITPPASFEKNTAEVPADTFPSASPTFNLAVGVNQFLFTGQTLAKHPTQGVDWDLYTIADEAQQAVIGNWGDAEANETQDILRVHGNDGFWTIIIPYDKGTRPSNLSVTQDPVTNDAVITYNGKTIRANEHYSSYTDGTKTTLTSYDASAVSGNNMTINGGPMEISLVGNNAALTFHGTKGVRTFTLPLNYPVVSGVTLSDGTYSYNYTGTAPVTLTLTICA